MAVAARQVELPASAIAPDLAHLQALRGEWAGLWSRSPELGPFSAPAWTLPWAQTHAPERTFAVGLRRGGGLAALVPAFTWRGAAYLAGAGPSDYGEAMVGADDAEGIVAELCEAAAQRGAALVRLPQLRPGNPLLQARGPAGWRSEVVQGEVCPTAPIRGEDGLGAMEPGWRKKLEYARRRLAREVSHLYRLAAGETLQADLAILESLHARRWAERGEPGVLSDGLTGPSFAPRPPSSWPTASCGCTCWRSPAPRRRPSWPCTPTRGSTSGSPPSTRPTPAAARVRSYGRGRSRPRRRKARARYTSCAGASPTSATGERRTGRRSSGCFGAAS